MNILCVDDESLPLLALTMELRRTTKYHIDGALSGCEAITLLEKEEYRIIISDLSMPGMNGGELLKIVKERWPKVKTILLTGYIEGDIDDKLLTSGCVDKLLTKPWSPKDLVEEIEKLTGN